MKISSEFLEKLIREEMSLLDEGCGEVDTSGDECPVCAAGLECPCDDETDLGDFRNLNQTNISPDEAFTSGCSVCGGDHDSHDHDSELTSIPVGTITSVEDSEYDPDSKLLSKVEALRVVTAIAQNTSCPVTRDALLDVVEDLGVGAGEEWRLEDDGHESESFEDNHPESSHGDWSDWAVSGGSSFDVPDERLEGG